MQDSYDAGKGMELLQQAVGHWASRPHVVKYIVGEKCADTEKVRTVSCGLENCCLIIHGLLIPQWLLLIQAALLTLCCLLYRAQSRQERGKLVL